MQTTKHCRPSQTSESLHSGGTPGSSESLAVRDPNAAFERWLQYHLRQLYLEVCREPEPSDLIEVIDRFRKKRQDPPDDQSGPGRVTAPW